MLLTFKEVKKVEGKSLRIKQMQTSLTLTRETAAFGSLGPRKAGGRGRGIVTEAPLCQGE